jgi:hypothetical protein
MIRVLGFYLTACLLSIWQRLLQFNFTLVCNSSCSHSVVSSKKKKKISMILEDESRNEGVYDLVIGKRLSKVLSLVPCISVISLLTTAVQFGSTFLIYLVLTARSVTYLTFLLASCCVRTEDCMNMFAFLEIQTFNDRLHVLVLCQINLTNYLKRYGSEHHTFVSLCHKQISVPGVYVCINRGTFSCCIAKDRSRKMSCTNSNPS